MKKFTVEVYKDERGEIINCSPMNPDIKNVMYITGRKGDQRANHYHKKDSHYWLVISGMMTFQWQMPGETEVHTMTLNPGDIVLSEPMEKHRFIFETDGVAIAMATAERTPELYESDTVRVSF